MLYAYFIWYITNNKSISGWRICDHARLSKWTTIFPRYLTFGGKKSKFRRIKFLHMAILHIYMRYQHHPMKIVGRVCESMKKRPKTTLLTPIFDLWGKKSKFRRITFLHMAILHISMWYQHNPMKTVGRVRESMKKWPKTTSFSPAVTLTRWPWNLCPDIHVSKVNIPCKFREI